MERNAAISILVIATMIFLAMPLPSEARTLANYSEQDAFDWLLSQGENGSYASAMETAAVILALDSAGGSASHLKDALIGQKNAQNACWPSLACKVKDTALAALALKTQGEDTLLKEVETWLTNTQTPSLTQGNWWLEVDTSETGQCSVKYSKGTREITKNVDVAAGTFPKCGGTTFFDLEKCVEPGLLNNYASLVLDVDCTPLTNAIISIVYNSGRTYYLYEEASTRQAEIIVKNGCFGTTRGSCDYDSSVFAEWALKAIGSTTSSELYLKDKYEPSRVTSAALMYLITEDPVYAADAVKKQKSDGSFDSDTLGTAFAIIALKASEYSAEVAKAQEWLMTKQKDDGSWDGNVYTTAIVLYALSSGSVELPSCTDGKKNQGERGIDCGGPCEEMDNCCYNGIKDEGEREIDCGGACGEECGATANESLCSADGTCDIAAGENCKTCEADCGNCDELCDNGVLDKSTALEEDIDCGPLCPVSCADKMVCNNDGICNQDLKDKGLSSNEDSQNCPNDCYCGDGVCDAYERSYGTCTKSDDYPDNDCEPEEEKCGNGVCDSGEDSSNCPADCPAEKTISCINDGTCDYGNTEDCTCEDCKKDEEKCPPEKKGFPWWLIIIFVLLIGGGAVFYLKFMKPKKKKPETFDILGRGMPGAAKPFESKLGSKEKFKITELPKTQPATGFSGMAASKPMATRKLDEEIDRSISEAQKLLKGKDEKK